MKIPLFLKLLLPCLFLRFSIVGEEGGGSPAENQGEQPEAPPAKVPAQNASPRIGLITQVVAGMKDKASLVAEIQQLKAKNQELEGQVLTLSQERDAAVSEKQALEQDFEKIDQALKTAETTAKTVDQAAAAKIVEAGFSPAALPGALEEQEQETRESLEAKIAVSTSDKEKWALIEKLKALG